MPKDSPYPHQRRLRARFSAARTKASSPYVVGAKIQQIVESESWQLRYPVGVDAVSIINWRASKTDEEIIDLGAESDVDYKARMKREFGLDVIL